LRSTHVARPPAAFSPWFQTPNREKPIGINHPEENRLIKNFLTLIKTYSKVKVIKRNSIKNKIDKEEKKTTIGLSNNYISSKICDNKKYVAIGVSTGGPKVLKTIFSNITNSFPCAIIVVQHITPGFMENMITWLNNFTSIPISIAKHNEELKSGHIYFAPDYFQIGVSNNFIHLSKNIEELKFCPSIDHLFYSLANKNGYETIGILLTGMGDDGARGLKKLKDNGAETIVQDKESSMIFGMPNEAIKLGAEKHILNPEQFSEFLRNSENK
jgi:two-component system chemotaxis response regulator CheB